MKIISVMGRKGGITKTTLATNLAAGCARAGLKTVLIDADGQANTSRIVRIAPQPGFANLILGDQDFSAVLRPVPSDFAGMQAEFYLLPSDDSQREVEQNPATPGLIYDRFGELEGVFDVAIVDTSPGITEVHAGFYFVSDYVILPTTLEFASITSLASTFSYLSTAAQAGATLGYPVAQVMGILPNRFVASEKVQQSNVGYLKGKYGDKITVFDSMRNLTVWNQASQLRQSIYAYAPADDYSARRQARVAANELKPVLDAVLSLFEVAAQ